MEQWINRPIGRESYMAWGWSLAFGKYLVEAYAIFFMTGNLYTPWAYVLPLVSLKNEALIGAPTWFSGLLLIWTLPFLLVGLMLTIRRCLDINASPWTAFWMLCPIINIPFLIGMSLRQSVQREAADELDMLQHESQGPTTMAGLRAVILGLLPSAAMLILVVYVLGNYGVSLFFITPIIMGAITAHQYQSSARVGLSLAIGAAMFCVTCALALMLLLALQGLVCIVMAAPIVYGGGLMGAFLGYAIAVAESARSRSLMPAIVVLPLIACFEHLILQPSVIEVVSSVEIEATCEQVWPAVIAFSPIDTPPNGILSAGLAYPIRARIEGEGVGAIRYCEFSTGAFVEPITRWDAPHRLAFNVTSQPCPMTEWSPYGNIHPPHLDGFLASQRGEFRLIELPQGRMRLEGHTWYSVDMYPEAYWQLWSDAIIHAIHMRVLSHIKHECETKNVSSSRRS